MFLNSSLLATRFWWPLNTALRRFGGAALPALIILVAAQGYSDENARKLLTEGPHEADAESAYLRSCGVLVSRADEQVPENPCRGRTERHDFDKLCRVVRTGSRMRLLVETGRFRFLGYATEDVLRDVFVRDAEVQPVEPEGLGVHPVSGLFLVTSGTAVTTLSTGTRFSQVSVQCFGPEPNSNWERLRPSPEIPQVRGWTDSVNLGKTFQNTRPEVTRLDISIAGGTTVLTAPGGGVLILLPWQTLARRIGESRDRVIEVEVDLEECRARGFVPSESLRPPWGLIPMQGVLGESGPPWHGSEGVVVAAGTFLYDTPRGSEVGLVRVGTQLRRIGPALDGWLPVVLPTFWGEWKVFLAPGSGDGR